MNRIQRASGLDRRIQLQQKSVGTSTIGNRTESWSTVATVWASIQVAAGREQFAAKQVEQVRTFDISIRWRSGLTPYMRIYYVDVKNSNLARYFNIRAVENPNDGRELLVLRCDEVTA